MKTYSHAQLFQFAYDVFLKCGCSEQDAKTAANVLLSADMRGVDSHGVARLSGYVRLWKTGRINPKPELKIIHETPSTAVVDADRALGLVAAPFAMKIAIEKAKNCGSGWVSVKNSNHFGIAGIHAMMTLEHDMIGVAMTNASALVAPTYSTERLLGTNPIAIAIPAGKEEPFVADFATTTASNGKLEILQRKNEEAPEGWVQMKDGSPTTKSDALKNEGAILPLGGDKIHGSHKGYALGSIVDIFSGVLSGANFGPWVPPFPAYVPMPENQPGEGLGHFFGAMRIDGFRTKDAFKKDMDQWIRRFKSAASVAGKKVVIPGEPEREMESIRKMSGIPLLEKVVNDLEQLSEEMSLKFPEEMIVKSPDK